MSDSTLNVGDMAPDFTLKDQHEQEISLSSLRGQKVILSFHPLAWTGICAQQMQQLDERREALAERNAIGLGLSIDTLHTKKAWAKALSITGTSLLADFWPHGAIAKTYGIFRESNGFSERAVFIINEEGKIAWKKVYPIGELPDIEEILAAV